VTPDSFSDGGQFLSKEDAIRRALQMVAEGADAIDVGGESTRPGSERVSTEVEIDRVLPVISELSHQTAVPISIDTSKAIVAERALDAGASIVNDVTAGRGDSRMTGVVAQSGAGMVLMHMQGEPRTMQDNPQYDDVAEEVRDFLAARSAAVMQGGVDRTRVLLDPGIGFGKNLDHNLLLLRRLDVIAALGFPLLVGTSRKAFIGRVVGSATPEARLEGTIASCLYAVSRGARVLRVHDVAAVKRALDVWLAIERAGDHGAIPRGRS
jgi:dihydropteroate synthase